MPWSPIIQESRVDRPDESIAGVGRQGNITDDDAAASPTRNTLDSGKAAGIKVNKFTRSIDTTQTDHLTVPYDITNAG